MRETCAPRAIGLGVRLGGRGTRIRGAGAVAGFGRIGARLARPGRGGPRLFSGRQRGSFRAVVCSSPRRRTAGAGRCGRLPSRLRLGWGCGANSPLWSGCPLTAAVVRCVPSLALSASCCRWRSLGAVCPLLARGGPRVSGRRSLCGGGRPLLGGGGAGLGVRGPLLAGLGGERQGAGAGRPYGLPFAAGERSAAAGAVPGLRGDQSALRAVVDLGRRRANRERLAAGALSDRPLSAADRRYGEARRRNRGQPSERASSGGLTTTRSASDPAPVRFRPGAGYGGVGRGRGRSPRACVRRSFVPETLEHALGVRR